MNLRYTPELHQALHDVAASRIVYHAGNTGPMHGFYWAPSSPIAVEGHPCPPKLAALGDLLRAELIKIVPTPDPRWRGNPVRITAAGTQLLGKWSSTGTQVAA